MGHSIKTGDTPTLRWTLGRDITGATCRILIADRTGTLVVDRQAIVEDPTGGIVSLTLGATELPEGTYRVEVETTTGEIILTHPDNRYESIAVMPDLG